MSFRERLKTIGYTEGCKMLAFFRNQYKNSTSDDLKLKIHLLDSKLKNYDKASRNHVHRPTGTYTPAIKKLGFWKSIRELIRINKMLKYFDY